MSPADSQLAALEHRQASGALRENRTHLAAELVTVEFQRRPELLARYGSIAREKSLQDAGYHLDYLAEAVEAGMPALFLDYIGWVKVVLAQRGVLPSDLLFHLQCLREVLEAELPPACRPAVREVLDHALAAFASLPEQLPTCIEPDAPHAALTREYLQAVLRGERRAASRLILEAVERGVRVKEIYVHVFQRGQYEIGRLWQSNQISVAQEHYCTAATQLIMSQLYPQIVSQQKVGGSIVATCVAGDLHDLGIRMIADFFEMAGWDSYYLGASTPAVSVVQSLIERRADVLGISATITYHVPMVAQLVREVRATPACAGVTILVGGYPFNVAPELWRTVAADGYARNAEEAITVAARLTRRG